MNFFEHQEQARQKTRLLTVYFLLAVIAIVVAVNIPVYLAVVLSDTSKQVISLRDWCTHEQGIITTLIVLFIIFMISFFRAVRLSGGGEAVARMAGAIPLEIVNAPPEAQKLINVVEEMAIASGVKVPKIFILPDEMSINAFAAGTTEKDAAIAVTQGAMEQLSRDELQGVIAHEFSHILNGDMWLNVKLISTLAGIVAIGQLGSFFLRINQGSRSSRNNSEFALAVFGLGLVLIGSIGVFFSRIIKASISRQREFLADASAVQFTRNPNGIASALNRIRLAGSSLHSRHAEDISHMCFATTLQSLEQTLFATHPDIKTRIKKIDPLFDFSQGKSDTTRIDSPARFTPDLDNWSQAPAHAKLAVGAIASISDTVGNPSLRHIDYAEAVHRRIPDYLLKCARFPEGALAIIYALLLNQNQNNIKEAISLLHEQESELFVDEVLECYNSISLLSPITYLALFDIAINSVRNVGLDKITVLIRTANRIAHLDGKFTLSEFVYITLIEKYLLPGSKPGKTINQYADVTDSISVVLGNLVRTSGGDDTSQTQSFARVMRYFQADISKLNLPRETSIIELKTALQQLARLSPLLKRPLIEACTDAVLHDKRVTVEEGELLRAISAALDCPMPPILPSQSKIA